MPNHWLKPRGGILKVNVDAVVFDEDHAYGVGIVIRNSKGAVIAAKAQKESRPCGCASG